MKKKHSSKFVFNLETLKHWKNVSTRAKLVWLEDALKFGKQKKF
ncbi:MAG: hypothetical protein AAB588_06505 [Patescibacteria group bacterium]